MGGEIYVFDPGESEDARRWRKEQAAAVASARQGWIDRAVELTGTDRGTVTDVVAVLFDHQDEDGSHCSCGCHPRFSTTHAGGFDCPCTWSAERREQAHAQLVAVLERTPEQLADGAVAAAELAAWIAARPGVEATKTCFACPEVWEGRVDGRTFHFRERHGEWRIELNLRPSGRFANRFVRNR